MTATREGHEAKPAKRSVRRILLPNSTPCPNWIFDSLLSDPDVPHALRSVLLFLVRKTVGWDRRSDEISLDQIENGASVSRKTAIHAVRVICECWGLFHKTRGQLGQHSSIYTVAGLSEAEFQERYCATADRYGTGCPKPEQLRRVGTSADVE